MNTYAEKFNVKTLIIAVLALAIGFVTGLISYPALAEDTSVQVEVNDKLVQFPDQKPYVDRPTNRTYIPVRGASEALGAKVDWDQERKMVLIEKSNQDLITLEIGSKQPKLNGTVMAVTLDAPARLERGPGGNWRTMVPLRFISETLGYNVLWDGDNRLVRISDKPFVATKELTAEQKQRLMAYPYPTYPEGTFEVENGKRISKAGKPIPVEEPMVECCKISTEQLRANQDSPRVPRMASNENFGDVMVRAIQQVGVLQSNQRFIMDDDLIYQTKGGDTWVRGILQTYKPDGSITEQDMEYAIAWGKPFSAPGEPQQGYRNVLDRKNPLSKAKRVQ